MPKVQRRATNPHGEVRSKSRAAILGLFGVSQVQNHAKLLTGGLTINTVPGVAMPISTYDKFIDPIPRYFAAILKLVYIRTN
ncbi:hypothetical protein GCM10009304_30640 [Pseudomonas matsuisoli]|uniref:Uncharacterized protein n=1 Tax=Pseudomonas matsuisoli TaxID=1515666 RepID=A0A917PZS1_9PSED|nr:hypothetical protein GCM10009304_30640 [Pseudomonas matsuisoli]